MLSDSPKPVKYCFTCKKNLLLFSLWLLNMHWVILNSCCLWYNYFGGFKLRYIYTTLDHAQTFWKIVILQCLCSVLPWWLIVNYGKSHVTDGTEPSFHAVNIDCLLTKYKIIKVFHFKPHFGHVCIVCAWCILIKLVE